LCAGDCFVKGARVKQNFAQKRHPLERVHLWLPPNLSQLAKRITEMAGLDELIDVGFQAHIHLNGPCRSVRALGVAFGQIPEPTSARR
jgi:hypothetical protein